MFVSSWRSSSYSVATIMSSWGLDGRPRPAEVFIVQCVIFVEVYLRNLNLQVTMKWNLFGFCGLIVLLLCMHIATVLFVRQPDWEI